MIITIRTVLLIFIILTPLLMFLKIVSNINGTYTYTIWTGLDSEPREPFVEDKTEVQQKKLGAYLMIFVDN